MAIVYDTTDHFTMTLGVVPGYFHDNEGTRDVFGYAHYVAEHWQRLSLVIEEELSFRLTAVVQPAVAAYATARGCPPGGENIVVITGTRNPQYTPDGRAWRRAVIAMARSLKKALGQKTAQLDFDHVDFVYLND